MENFDEITLADNQCLECHAPVNAKKKDAPVLGERHLVAGSGAVSQARYACVMCHVPQSDAKPLVDNTFQGDRLIPAAQKR